MGIEGWATAARHRAGPVATTPRPRLTARLLGGLWIVVDGQVVDTASSRRTRNVLAYLLTHRETPVPRDVLMDVFWGNAGARGRAQQRARRAQRGTPGAAGDRCRSRCWSAGTTRTGSPTGWTSGSTRRRSSRPAGRVGGPRRPGTAGALRAYERAGPALRGRLPRRRPVLALGRRAPRVPPGAGRDVACRQVALYGRLGDDSSAAWSAAGCWPATRATSRCTGS